MNIDKRYKPQHSAYRKYLRGLGIKSQSIDNLVNALEIYLPRFINERIDSGFTVIYDDSYDITYLLRVLNKFKSNQDWLVESQGYSSQEALKYYINFFAETNGINLEDYLAPQMTDDTKHKAHIEGEAIERESIRYERDPTLRDECIDKYGCKCFVCGFDFERVYGEAGQGFIEVHHLSPLSIIRESHITTVDDLRPLCSNCHSIIHRRKDPERNYYTIDELKELIVSR